jgi:DNA-directed primase/polymerase protein
VDALARKDGTNAFIRTWEFFRERNMIVYQMGGSRYCDNIGRQHKSNHIMIVVDLNLNILYQKCMDPICRKTGFRSVPHSIPMELNPLKNSSIEDERMFGDIDDGEFIHLYDNISL